MKRLLAAIRFLTIFPFPAAYGAGTEENDLAASVPAFPIVGILIGIVLANIAWGAAALFPPLVASVIVMLALVAASGGLHLDGLSDTADGFFSSRPRERILEIMRDSHIGAMGAAAIVAIMLLKISALASIDPAEMWRTAFLMPIAGRCAMVLMMTLLPYARPEGGLGSLFYRSGHAGAAIWSLVVLVVAGWLLAKWAGLAAAMATVGSTLLFCWVCRRKIGGATGDTFGAACEIAEAAPALVMAAWPAIRWHFRGHGL